MYNIFKPILILLAFSVFVRLTAQNKVQVNVQSRVHVSSKDNLLPLYQYSNQWGIVSPFEQGQALVVGGLKYNFVDTKNINFQLGFSGVAKNKVGDSFLHEAYLKGRFFNFIDFNIGKQAYASISIDDNLTTGGFMMNSNARPAPKAMIGIYDYWPSGFLRGFVQIKGGLSQGILNDDRLIESKYNSAKDILVHEKWVYARMGLFKLKPYAGLYHGALYGGTRSDGREIPADFWATFKGAGSNKIGGGEATNAAGAHDGFWDLGLEYTCAVADFQLYLQKPYADGSGLKIAKGRNHDYKMGIYAKLKNTQHVKKVSFELIKTDYQAGSGIPDPLSPDGNGIIFLDQIEDYDAFMYNHFGEEKQDGYSLGDVKRYLEVVQNHNQKYGGRDDYNNNGTYYSAWTYHQMPMGLPLYHTYWQAKAYAPDWIPNNHGVFLNNRIKGFHIGLEGEFSNNLRYLFKSTYTINKGSYAEQYIKRYSWEEDSDFFYKGGKKEVYTYLSLDYKNSNWKYFTLRGSFSYDFGELYHSFGCMLSIRYSPSINL